VQRIRLLACNYFIHLSLKLRPSQGFSVYPTVLKEVEKVG
jgi:hypothetical protein